MIPTRVTAGMALAALARAEHCDVEHPHGRLALRSRYEPSFELEIEFAAFEPDVVGCLGWAIPILRTPAKRPFAASCPYTLGNRDAWGAN